LLGTIDSASYALNAKTASYLLGSIESASYAIRIGKKIVNSIPIIASSDQITSLVGIPYETTDFGSEVYVRADLTDVASCSLSLTIEKEATGPTSVTCSLSVQYSVDDSLWYYLSANPANLPSVAMDSVGSKLGDRVAIVSDAKQIVTLRLVTNGGDASNDNSVTVGNVTLNAVYDL
jgi:hypothetical protein